MTTAQVRNVETILFGFLGAHINCSSKEQELVSFLIVSFKNPEPTLLVNQGGGYFEQK